MDNLTFIIRLIEAIAWPVAAVAVLLTFRQEFRALVPLIRRLKAGPLEAEFEREVREISEEVASTVQTEAEEEIDDRRRMLMELALINPRSAILEAWLGVETAVRKAVGSKMGRFVPRQAIRNLLESEIISGSEYALFEDLRALRNNAAHHVDFNPTTESVQNYVDLASALVWRIERNAATPRSHTQ